MYLSHLSILNYKNISQADLTLSPGINCFLGSNGEGKTNVLDSIYFLSFTKSSTNVIDSLNIRHGEELLMLKGEYDLNGVHEVVSCGMKLHQKKQFRRGDKVYKRMSEHIGLLPLILVSPNDQDLVSGGSEQRRHFLDTVISQYNPSYLQTLQRYNKALQHRNALLKEENAFSMDLMEAYERIMADSGEIIYGCRQSFINDFIPVFQKYYARISSGKEQIGINYTSHCDRGSLLDVIQRDRPKDLAVGYSLHGIHKDDIEMMLNGYPLKKEGSQGQSKSYLISLKLAQFNFLKKTGSHTKPLLLLDDIFDKLDSERVGNIVGLVSEEDFGQIFITDTNLENLDRILSQTHGRYKIFHVKGGVITS
jgi:DNA replication and repair protein RecF